jgi:DNA polymerase III sliding clamp (beta) subunit (PCNA family)
MNSTAIPAWMLAAVAPFMAKGDVRFYLNSVCVCAHGPDKTMTVVATDGHAMGIASWPGIVWHGDNVILPRAAIEAAVKMKSDAFAVSDGFLVADNGAKIPAAPIDGRFPEWQAVAPLKQKNEGPASVNLEIIGQVLASCKALVKHGKLGKQMPGVMLEANTDHAMLWQPNGLLDGARVNYVVMPLRTRGPLERI